MVHGRSIRQVKRLFHRLYNPDDFIYIHVDSRSQYMYDHLKPLENGRFNVIVTETRFATIWGGVSLLTMMISSMREMLESQWDMDFIINVSGSDYLIKTLWGFTAGSINQSTGSTIQYGITSYLVVKKRYF